jgi:urate oxidase
MLMHSSYGKERVRLVQVLRRADRHGLRDLTVGVRFEGAFEAAYLEGDNSAVLPTDTMKNTVYALAAREPVREPEPFGRRLAAHFLEGNGQLARVTIELVDHLWSHLPNGEREHPHAFSLRGPETRTATVTAAPDALTIRAGIADLMILKSAHSAFAGFPRDELTTLPETRDRVLATSLTASWEYRDANVDFGPVWHVVRRTMLDTFAEHRSESVQHTLYAMGQAVLDAVDVVSSIRLVMPNRHHLPFDLTTLGEENRNEIFVPTQEPHGLISATVTRPTAA